MAASLFWYGDPHKGSGVGTFGAALEAVSMNIFIGPGAPVLSLSNKMSASQAPLYALTLPRCLNVHWFDSIEHAKAILEAWRHDYNESRPHTALNNVPPVVLARLTVVQGKLPGI